MREWKGFERPRSEVKGNLRVKAGPRGLARNMDRSASQVD